MVTQHGDHDSMGRTKVNNTVSQIVLLVYGTIIHGYNWFKIDRFRTETSKQRNIKILWKNTIKDLFK